MSPFRVLFWRFAWSRWDDVAYQTEFYARPGHVLVAKYRRLFLGLWFATIWKIPRRDAP